MKQNLRHNFSHYSAARYFLHHDLHQLIRAALSACFNVDCRISTDGAKIQSKGVIDGFNDDETKFLFREAKISLSLRPG